MALLAGPATFSGETFLTPAGVPTASTVDSNNNLLKQLDRVQSFSYNYNIQRNEVKQLGTSSLVARPIITSPTISINFDYLVANVRNESRLGFFVNYPVSGVNEYNPLYADNYNVNLIRGFTERDLAARVDLGSGNILSWPMAYRDKKNLYLITAPPGEDIYNPSFTSGNYNTKANRYEIYAFGNCYIESYSTQAAVGSLPIASVSYVAENVLYHLSGSGVSVPSVNAKDRTVVSGVNFVLPPVYEAGGPTVLHPGDITIDISSTGNPGMNHFGFKFTNIKLASYSINMNFQREELNSIGFKLPWDREINLPVLADLSFNCVPGANITGSFADLINNDWNYDATIKLKTKPCPESSQYEAVRYDFRGMKVHSNNYGGQISSSNSAAFSFTTEIPYGLFISGVLGYDEQTLFPNRYLLIDDTAGAYPAGSDGSYLLQEDGYRIILDEITPY
jgi:hypothetical protein